ncbi:MarC family protein [Halarcobacter anaerophilus]|uniref:MarC family protein n=1 Tax=Halarcobacter anaerophilus TaxID=877500 RepID=UPI0019D71CEE
MPLTFLCFIFGSKILGILGKNGLNIVTRLMGLILRVIGVQRLIEGASDIYTMLIK